MKGWVDKAEEAEGWDWSLQKEKNLKQAVSN